MLEKKSPPEQKFQESSPHAGFTKILHWPAYEAFRSRALFFLIVYNLLLIVTNICLAFSLAFGQVLATAGTIAGAGAIFVAVQFSEDIRKHFKGNQAVQASIRHAEDHLDEPETAIKFIQTIDGQLVLLAVFLGIIMVVQFWRSLH